MCCPKTSGHTSIIHPGFLYPSLYKKLQVIGLFSRLFTTEYRKVTAPKIKLLPNRSYFVACIFEFEAVTPPTKNLVKAGSHQNLSRLLQERS